MLKVNLKERGKIMEKQKNIKFKELTKRRISLVKKVVEEYNYIISRG